VYEYLSLVESVRDGSKVGHRTLLRLGEVTALRESVVVAYRQLAGVEARFRVLKDFLHLRPVRHWTNKRVRGHVAVCVHAAVIETLINNALAEADVRDPDLTDQHLSANRALRELNRIRRHHLTANGRRIQLTTRRTPLQARALIAIGADTATWDKANIT